MISTNTITRFEAGVELKPRTVDAICPVYAIGAALEPLASFHP
jgi:hypothetical protein